MFELLRHLRPEPDPIDPALWRATIDAVPWLEALDETRRQTLQRLAAIFLQRKTITPIGGLHLDALQRCMLAALCCLPLLQMGAKGLRGWTQLIVYPEAFRVPHSHLDSAGVLHEGHIDVIGEAWEAGPLILSWADILADCADPHAGHCVAVHEIAHKLDLLDGVLDGTPPLSRAWQREWARDFQLAYDGLVVRVQAGHETPIDPYAAEAPEEFFAVLTEYHFSDPQLLCETMPSVAEHLRRLYGDAPFAHGAGPLLSGLSHA